MPYDLSPDMKSIIYFRLDFFEDGKCSFRPSGRKSFLEVD
jgi:hypothetical protein